MVPALFLIFYGMAVPRFYECHSSEIITLRWTTEFRDHMELDSHL